MSAQEPSRAAVVDGAAARHEEAALLACLSALTLLVFFQAFMIAPLIPRLANALGTTPVRIGLVVPAYLLPYGIATLFWGVLSDRLGGRRLMLLSLAAFAVLTAATALAQSAQQLIAARFLTGAGASGIVPLSLALIGRRIPFERRGRALGWLFGAMAGGMAFGSSFGTALEPALGWRGLFLGAAGIGVLGLLWLLRYRHLLGEPSPQTAVAVREVMRAYAHLIGTRRGRRTYAYVLLNAVFHSGVYTWLGLYFVRRYQLGEIGVALALLGYGIPGLLLGPWIGRAADRFGRRALLPAGVAVAALSAGALAAHFPAILAGLFVTLLSLGYDMTQPLLAGIVTTFDQERPGQAMGLNVFALFTGFALGSVAFSALLPLGFGRALAAFAAGELLLALFAFGAFRQEDRPV